MPIIILIFKGLCLSEGVASHILMFKTLSVYILVNSVTSYLRCTILKKGLVPFDPTMISCVSQPEESPRYAG